MLAMTWAPNPRSPAGTGCGQVWEAVLAEQAGRNAPPACAEAVVRRDSVSSLSLLSQSSWVTGTALTYQEPGDLAGRWAQGATASSPC